MKGSIMRFHYFIKWPHSMRGLTRNCVPLAGSSLCCQSHAIGCGSSMFNEIGRNNRHVENILHTRNYHVSFVLNASNSTSSHKFNGVNNNNILPKHSVLWHPLFIQSEFRRVFSDEFAGTHSKQRKQKTPKPSIKEFNFTGKIKDHDLNVKFSKIQGLLEKGKMVRIFLRIRSRDSKLDAMPVAKFQQKLNDFMGPLGKLHKDFSNETVTRFTLTPIIQKESEKSNENQIDDYGT